MASAMHFAASLLLWLLSLVLILHTHAHQLRRQHAAEPQRSLKQSPLHLYDHWASSQQHMAFTTEKPASQRAHHHLTLKATNELSNHGVDYDYYSDAANTDNDDDDVIGYATAKAREPQTAVQDYQAAQNNLKRIPRDHLHVWAVGRQGDSLSLSNRHSQQNHNHLDEAAVDPFDADYPADQAPGVVTAQKLQKLGTHENVQKEFRRHQEHESYQSNNQNLMKWAHAHRMRAETETRCMWPQKRVIYIRNGTAKRYTPRATVLHRCDEATGCCTDYKICTAKTQELVQLAFWERSQLGDHPVLLSLANHTECHCVNVSTTQRKRRNALVTCKCPRHFNSFSWAPETALSAHCRCDCHLKDLTCQRMKNGEEGFAVSDRNCISSEECSMPMCNYGLYSKHNGRCPRANQQKQQQQRGLHGYG